MKFNSRLPKLDLKRDYAVVDMEAILTCVVNDSLQGERITKCVTA